MRRDEVLQTLAKHRTDELVLTTMSVAPEWPAYSQSDYDFNALAPGWDISPIWAWVGGRMPGSEGIDPQRRWQHVDEPGRVVSIAHTAPRNLILFVFENEIYARLPEDSPSWA
jgi:hypothetical protein